MEGGAHPWGLGRAETHTVIGTDGIERIGAAHEERGLVTKQEHLDKVPAFTLRWGRRKEVHVAQAGSSVRADPRGGANSRGMKEVGCGVGRLVHYPLVQLRHQSLSVTITAWSSSSDMRESP